MLDLPWTPLNVKADEEEEDEYLAYNGMKRVLVEQTPDLVYVYVLDMNNQEFVYLYKDVDFYNMDEYSNETGEPMISLNPTYCIKLKFERHTVIISMITTKPTGCDSLHCKRLNGLFKEMDLFLQRIQFQGRIELHDDVQIDGVFITGERLKNGKGSIYEKYGFRIEPEYLQQLHSLQGEADTARYNAMARNIPMYLDGPMSKACLGMRLSSRRRIHKSRRGRTPLPARTKSGRRANATRRSTRRRSRS